MKRWINDPATPATVARTLAALGQCATVLVTWALFSARRELPLLPLGPSIALPFGHALIATALASIVFPRVGSVSHAVVLMLAMIADTARVQPSVYTLAAIMVGASFGARGWVFARVFLGAMYFYAGLNKLLSPGWFTGTAPWLLTALTKTPTALVSKWFPWVIAGGEALLGVLVMIPRARRLAAIGAVLMHAGILYDLGPWGHKWNESVWPWNIALALAAPLLLWPWHGEKPKETIELSSRAALVASGWLIVAPLLWHVGLWPAYFAHHLYSEDLPTAQWCTRDGLCQSERGNDEVWNGLKVPLSPSVPIIKRYFLARCAAGDRLVVRDSRRWFVRRGQGEVTVLCAR